VFTCTSTLLIPTLVLLNSLKCKLTFISLATKREKGYNGGGSFRERKVLGIWEMQVTLDNGCIKG
jgi:hypothetical protein